MPTRKQRRRREKDFRHDVRVYEVDERGTRSRSPSCGRRRSREAEGKTTQKGGRPARVQRVSDPPSWDRAFKRGGMMGVLMIVVLYFLQGPVGSAFGVVYGAMFVPLTYWLDRTKYRMDLKRAAQPPPPARSARPRRASSGPRRATARAARAAGRRSRYAACGARPRRTA